MILWFVDRFGLPGKYHRIWINLLTKEGINPRNVVVVSLHNLMRKQLLTKMANRKAPTWVPELTDDITTVINQQIFQYKPKAVVLSSPESLVVTGVHPEHATLHNLRGSVYYRNNLPHIVILPVSSWTSMVSQKEIGAANYGFENEAAFTARQQGPIHQTSGADRPGGSSASKGQAIDSGASRLRADDPLARLRAKNSERAAESDAAARTEDTRLGQSRLAGTEELNGIHGSGARISGPQEQSHGAGLRRVSDDSGEQGSGGSTRAVSGDDGDGSVLAESSQKRNPLLEMRATPSGSWPDRTDGDQEPDGVHSSTESGVSQGIHDVRDGGENEDSESDDSSDSDDVQELDDRADDAVDITPDDDESSGDEDMDTFFYEPVLSPVGKFVLTADVAKLNRLLRDGKESSGPREPYVLHALRRQIDAVNK